jgi:hypothetical protein
MSDEDNVGPNELVGDDARGNGAPSAETLAPNPIGSSSTRETRPLAVDQAIPTAPSGSGQKKKKCIVLVSKRKHDKAADDQVIIKLPLYRGPRSPLVIVAIEHIFGRLFEAF